MPRKQCPVIGQIGELVRWPPSAPVLDRQADKKGSRTIALSQHVHPATLPWAGGQQTIALTAALTVAPFGCPFRNNVALAASHSAPDPASCLRAAPRANGSGCMRSNLLGRRSLLSKRVFASSM